MSSALARAYQQYLSPGTLNLPQQARETAKTVRSTAESGLIGGALGAAHAAMANGLDYVVKPAQAAGAIPTAPGQPLSPAKEALTIPIDGVAAILGLGGSIAMAHEDGISDDLRNVGSAALAVFAFRKGADLMAAKMRKDGKASGGTVPSAKSLVHSMMTAHGEFGFGAEGSTSGDPIAALAEKL
jgi:hypothetical protein